MTTQLQPYPEYKDSGLPWLGRVPKHWELRRAKYLFGCVDRRSRYGQEELLTVSSKKGVVLRSSANVTMFQAESYVGHKLCWPGDLVINSLWAWARGLGFSRHHGIVSTAYGVYRLFSRFRGYEGYLDSLLRSHAYERQRRIRSKGIWTSRLQMTDEAFLDMPVVLPPPNEQEAIARYLDEMDRRISHFIRNRRRLIEVLTEQKQAIISALVCGKCEVTRVKGEDGKMHSHLTLRPSQSMKSSGIDWLGDIPTDWTVLRGKYLFWEADTRSREGNETHLSMSQKLGLVPASQLTERHFHSTSYAGGKLVDEGDIVLNRLKAHLGVFRLAEQAGVISPDYTVLRSRHRHSARYLELVLTSSVIRPELRCRVKGLVEGFWRLYTDDLYAVRLPVPPAQEQERVVDSCRKETAELDAAIRAGEREINLIREYRTRLIADVVTGKVDVRDLAPPPGSEDLEETVDEFEPLGDLSACNAQAGAAGELEDEALSGEVA